MVFEINRHSVTEGDVVELTWQCNGAERVDLTLDNGYRTTNIPLDVSGVKRFRLHRSKGRTRLTIAATMEGKVYRKTLRVRVKKMPVMRAETVDSRGRRQGKLKLWWQQQLTKWHNFRNRQRYLLRALPERKQVAVKMLLILGLSGILGLVWPGLYRLGMLALVIYLSVILIKR